MTLTEFLLERIAEDEADADRWHNITDDNLSNMDFFGVVVCRPEHVNHVDANCHCGGRARVLAECEAKRRVVDLNSRHLVEDWAEGYDEAHHDTLRLLALPYADHPDYRPEWAVAQEVTA